RRQEVRQRSAKPPPPVQIRAAPPKSLKKLSHLFLDGAICPFSSVPKNWLPTTHPARPAASASLWCSDACEIHCLREGGGFENLLSVRSRSPINTRGVSSREPTSKVSLPAHATNYCGGQPYGKGTLLTIRTTGIGMDQKPDGAVTLLRRVVPVGAVR